MARSESESHFETRMKQRNSSTCRPHSGGEASLLDRALGSGPLSEFAKIAQSVSWAAAPLTGRGGAWGGIVILGDVLIWLFR